MLKKQKGFTLIELLVVIVIIAILAIAVFVALDPARRFADARDSHRWSNVDSVLTAVHEYIVDNGGAMPPSLSATETQIGTAATGCATTDNGNACGTADVCNSTLATELATYLASMPADPQGSAARTSYSVVASGGFVTVTACDAENTTISVSR